MPQNDWYNVQNEVTGILILNDMGVPVEYPLDAANQVAINFTANTGQQHVIVGPHPKPRPHA